MIATFTYVLCAVTSIACTALLIRGYISTRARLLLWTSLCFTGFAINNILLVVDKANAALDLGTTRALPTAVGMALLLYGLVWESR